MSKEVKEYLDYLKENEYIWGYKKKDNYIILRYGLSSVRDTETNIEYNDNLRVFIENIRTKADELEDDIRGSLVDENDYYGYDTKEELDNRINEEREFLIDIVCTSNRIPSFEEERCSIVVDSDMNIYKVKEKKMIECFDKIIAPLDIYNQVVNETEMELMQELGCELNINYVKQLENGLMKALDELSQKSEDFDYYDKLRELTGFYNYQALDFLDMYSDNEGE